MKRKTMKRRVAVLRAFLDGIREYRSDLTLHHESWRLREAYDHGREWAHRLTLRRYD